MNAFFIFADLRIRRLRLIAEELEGEGKESESLKILCQAEEIEAAVEIVRQAVETAKKLKEIAAI